jgi:hypothetical protein
MSILGRYTYSHCRFGGSFWLCRPFAGVATVSDPCGRRSETLADALRSLPWRSTGSTPPTGNAPASGSQAATAGSQRASHTEPT